MEGLRRATRARRLRKGPKRRLRGVVRRAHGSPLMRLPLVALVCALALPGCFRVPDTMSDEEIRSKGLWTDHDEEARILLDRYVGPGRPVRYAPYSRKF